MDSEFKKLLAGAAWADTGDRVDMNDASIQPTIDRSEGYSTEFSINTTPARARINQIMRELYGAAKEVVRGVSAYDAEVSYPQGSICQANGDLYYATVAHNPSSPVNPLTIGQTAWALIAGRSAAERTVPAEVPSANIFIDGDRADRFQVWWYAPDNGGHPILQSQVRWAKDINFNTGSQTTGVPGFERTIADHDSDLYYVSVRSRNQLGWSPWSNAKRVRTSPVAPESVNFTRVIGTGTAGSGNVFWVRPEDNGLDISQFRVQWALETGQDFSTSDPTRYRLITVTDQTQLNYSTTISGLSSSQGLKFRVQAISNRGTTSAGGNEPSALLTGTNDVPSKPSVLSEAVSATRVRAWIDPFGFTDGGHPIQYYEWSWRVRGTSSWTTENLQVPIYIIKPDRGQLIDVRVRAYNGAGGGTGFSSYSDVHQVAAFSPSLPESPTISVASSTTAVADTLKGVVSFSMGNLSTPEVVKDRIIQTSVRWTPTGGSDWTQLDGSSYPNIGDQNFSGVQVFPASGNLVLDTALDVQARWRNSRGWSDWSDSVALEAVSAPSGNLTLSANTLTIAEGGTSTVNVRLSREPIENTTVAISSNNTDLTVSPNSLTFTDTNWGTDQTITLSAAADSDDTNDLAIVTLRTTGGLDVSDDTITVTIQEPVRLVAGYTGGTINIPEGGSAGIVVGLTAQPLTNVVVAITKTGSDDVSISRSSMTFTPSNWDNQQVVTITAASDADSANDTATLSFSATGGATDTFTRNVVVADGVTRKFLRTTPSGAEIGQGLSKTFIIFMSAAPAQGFVLNIKPVNPNHVSVSPSTMTFGLDNWSTAQTCTVSIPASAPAGANEWIDLEPQSAPDVQPHAWELITTTPLVELGSRSGYVIPEGNRVPRLGTSDQNYGVKINGTRPNSSAVTITPSSNNSDLSFSPTSRQITAQQGSASFTISAARDTDVMEENLPVVYTATGGLSSTLSVPTMVLEPTNALSTLRFGTDDIEASKSLRQSGPFNLQLLNAPPSDVIVRTVFVSGTAPSSRTNSLGVNYVDGSEITLTPSDRSLPETRWTWSDLSSFTIGQVVAVYDFIPRSTNSEVSIPIFRIRFVAGA